MRAEAKTRQARLHALAVGLSAFCLFAAQPLAARICLPRLGGTPAVWNATSTFFQVALVAAYFGAHLLARRLAPRSQMILYAGALVAASAAVWSEDPALALGAADEGSFGGLLLSLTAYLGLPAIALGMSTPLWSHRHVAAGLGAPYWLYAASNLGSFVALLAYPALLEPWLGVEHSFTLWRLSLGALALLALLAAFWGGSLERVQTPPLTREGRRAFGWALRAGLVAAYSLALTTYLSTDLAPAPWLWALPLAIYLATYVLAFSRFADRLWRLALPLVPLIGVVNVVLVMLEISRPSSMVIAALLLGEFALGLALHLDLARRRPAPEASTAYYGWIALGGSFGAVAVSWVAPTVMDRNLDLPLLLVACLWAFPKRDAASPRPGLALGLVGAALLALAMGLLWFARGPVRPGATVSAFAFALWLPLFWPTYRWPRVGARLAAALMLIATFAFESEAKVIALARSPVGSYRVTEDPERGLRSLSHGRTIHGAYALRPELAAWALPYHHPKSPIAARFAALERSTAPRPSVAVLGLGVGNMATYADDQLDFVFFEIDPLIEALARAHFPFLSNCPHCEVEIRDGRIGLAQTQTHHRMIVLDAFNSDAVPVHLLTLEALEIYLAALEPGGELMVHITNRHVDLRGPLGDAASALGLRAETQGYDPGADPDLDAALRGLVAPTLWVRLTRPDEVAPLEGWEPLPSGRAERAWTDDRASALTALGEALP